MSKVLDSMIGSFPEIVTFVIDELEGGEKVVVDAGGVTRYGISSRAHPGIDVANLTRDEAIAIYLRQYWIALRCDELTWPFNLVVFDCAVNQGQTFAKEVRTAAQSFEDAVLLRMSRYWSTAANPDEEPNFHGWIGRLIKVWYLGQQA